MNTKHCVPNELWRAAREQVALSRESLLHIESCPDCSTLWSVIQAFPGAQSAHLSHAPAGWIERAVAIARGRQLAVKLAKLVAHVSFDSWLTPSAVVLRGATGGTSRRLRWEVDTWSFDLRAEATESGWNCTAQVQEGGEPLRGVEITSGSLKVHTDHTGLATWSSARPPRTLVASDPVRSVKLGPLKWQPPKAS